MLRHLHGPPPTREPSPSGDGASCRRFPAAGRPPAPPRPAGRCSSPRWRTAARRPWPVLLLAALPPALPGGGGALLAQEALLFRPDAVYDGRDRGLRPGWVVLTAADGTIAWAGPSDGAPAGAAPRTVELPGTTLLPGLIEGHAHLLLHPYDETAWTDQVLREPRGERVARAVVHARATLMAGVTTVRDLGSEGAGYADVGLRSAIEKGVIPGPRLLVAGPAIVATGSYNPRGAPELSLPRGAEEADGVDELIRVTRDQIGRGADVVKVYADYRWGPAGEARPTFTLEELER
ncbi:MAG TPA: amidohydrolase family protein, partial [Longimicrobiales bacterium]|nr:amidohydrolase family protein [Longimicrobiales bacterium]